jgi:hypothetical protein
MKYHYVYSIVNTKNGMAYIGVRSSDVEPSSDLGIIYFSSSSDSNFINEQLECKELFQYNVLEIFKNREDAIKLEIDLHKKFNVGKNPMFYNKSRQTSTKFDYDITGNSDIARKISESLKGKPAHNLGLKQSEETKHKRSNSLKGKISPMLGKQHSEETKRKMSESALGKIRSEETKRKMSESQKAIERKPHSEETKQKMSESRRGMTGTMLGKQHSEETKQKMSESHIGKTIVQQKIKCPHCDKEGGASNMKRYHFNNCKNKN